MDYKMVIESIFTDIVNNYSLKLKVDKSGNVYLISEKFYVGLLVSREDIDIIYVAHGDKEKYYKYFMTTFIKKKFDDEERMLFGNPADNEERIISRMRVIAHGLNSKWSELLEGNQKWISVYKKDTFGGEPIVMNSPEKIDI